MKKHLLLAAAVSFVLATSASAQLGPWSPTNPLWIDLNNNGRVDPGETTLYPRVVIPAQATSPSVLAVTPSVEVVLEGNPFDPSNTHDTRIFLNAKMNPTVIARTCLGDPRLLQEMSTTNGRSYSFTETIGGIGTAAATAGLIDTNGDGVLDTFRIDGSHKGLPVVADVGLVFSDATGDGRADRVSIPWALAGIFGVPAGDPQVWLPLTADASGRPTGVTVAIPDPGVPGGTVGIDLLLPIVPAALRDASAVPGLSEMGLLALALSLGATGALLVRGRVLG